MRAIPPLAAANKIDPTNSEVMFDLGLASKNTGQPKVAMQWLAAVPKKNATAYYLLGDLYRDANNPNTAHMMSEATRLGLEEEKAGATLDWLTPEFYALGEIQQLAHNDVAARDAYQHFVDRSPPAGAQLTEARRLLNGELRR